ncbi:MAG TPA: PAS domain S-box protein [Actinomycetota bacterium]|nr:PAS domain S-box protein [Actinomycetota bacterium]
MRLEEESRRAEAMFQGLLESAPDAIVVMGSDGLIKLVNRQTEVLFGYSRDELIGQPVERLIPERLAVRHPELRHGYFSVPTVRAMGAGLELAARRKDGTEFPVDISLAPLETEEGTLVSAAVRDITERRRAEAKFQGLLESAPDAIVVVGSDGLIRLINRQTEVLFGYTRDELIGEPVERLIPKRLAEHHPDLRTGYFSAPAVRAMGAGLELAARRKDGTEFPVDISLAPLETEEGVLVSAAVRDVTERKRAEAELREREEQLAAARDQALEASRLKSQFLANMSHEIRTPMNGVLGMAELILTDDLPPQQRERMKNLKESGQGLLTIINDILDFSKMEAGKLELEEETFDLVAVARGVLGLLSSEAAARGLYLKLDLDPEVPRWVCGDSVRLRQILLNLTGNGIKFTHRGGVTLGIRRSDHNLRFTVTDTGVGMDPSSKQRLLEPFSQGDASTTREYGGTGLGLAICSQLIELMGGTLDLSSELGAGTSFWFEITLPPAEPPSSDGALEQPVPPGGLNGSKERGGRILLVDDVAINRVVAKGLLENLGFEVVTASSGVEAIASVEQNEYLAVLMDCLMPGMDGYETTRRIRALDGEVQKVPIIALTAAAMSGDRERCLAAGMDDYISKPLDLPSLRAALDRQTGGHRTQADKAAGTPPLEGADSELAERLADFKSRFPAETFRRICEEFLASTPQLLADIRASLEAGNHGTTASLAHKLKGSMGTFGALRMSELAQQLQTGSGDRPAAELLDELDARFRAAGAAVAAEVAPTP